LPFALVALSVGPYHFTRTMGYAIDHLAPVFLAHVDYPDASAVGVPRPLGDKGVARC